MYAAADIVLNYVISRGVPFIILLIVIYLIYRYYTYGKGNRTLLCPSTFGSTYDDRCLRKYNYIVDMKGELIKKSEL